MDQTLRCNSLPCRKLLYTEGRAVSTSCSHIFCHDCAVTLFRGTRACPACETVLESPDDCIVTVLNPSSSYKASILAGLTPNIIMEICTRAIGFYQYQSSQEAAFQQVILNKSQEMLERYALDKENLERKFEAEMALLKQKTKALQDDLNGEKSKNQELRQVVQTSRRDYEKLRTQLDQARRKAIGTSNVMSGSLNHDGGGFFGESLPPSTSAPQPFYTGRSTNSPVPFLSSQTEARQQTNLWQHQLQHHHLQQSPSPPHRGAPPLSHQRPPFSTSRQSATPMQTRFEVDQGHLHPVPTPSKPKPTIPPSLGRGVSTPLRAMPSPGYSPDRTRGAGHLATGKSARLHDL